jgi:hypothetical protein
MSDAEQIRVRAARLFALALKAREDEKLDYADELTKLASEAFDHATRLEATAPPTPPVAAPSQQQQHAQQQQQPRPRKK